MRTTWGRGLAWDVLNLWPLRLTLLGIAALMVVGWRRRWWAGSIATLGVVVALGAAILLGFHPGEGGRWSDRSFWIATRNTFVFVMLSVPVITGMALMLAIFLNHDSESPCAPAHALLPALGPLGQP